MASMTCEPILDPPCPRVTITVMGLPAGESVISLWRSTGGEDRTAVRGARGITVIDSFLVEDFAAPLAQDVTYVLEFLEGVDAGLTLTADTFLPSGCGYIQDPLDPSTAVPVYSTNPQSGGARLMAGSFAKLAYESTVNSFSVAGSTRPVVIGGARQVASSVPLALFTEAVNENDRMRALVRASSVLVIRPVPKWGLPLPGSGTYSASAFTEDPRGAPRGDALTLWETTVDMVRPSSARVLVSLFTYQDVADVFATYAQKQTASGGGTYLDDQKKPAGVDS